MGGELTYMHDGSTSGADFYKVKLIVYRYCDSTINPAPLDASMFLGIYTEVGPGILDWYSTESLTLVNSTFVTSNGNAGCSFTASACIERGEYEASILLPNNFGGYHLVVERCCRNGNIVNILNPGSAGMTFYGFIPGGVINSSPQITDVSVPYLCAGDTVSIINNAYDPDGDSLAYSFVIPYNGYSGPPNPVPDPLLDNNPYGVPIPEISYATGYSAANFLGAGSYAFIDPISGLTNYLIPTQGFYVAAIEIREYRNGILLSTIRRDLQFITIPCLPNSVPNYISGGGTPVYTVGEGQTLCFDISFSDADGDSLFLTASGPLLDPAVVNPPGTIADVNGDSTVTTEFCWTPICGMSRPVPYQFFVTVTDNGCPAKTTNEIFSVYVTSGPASQTALVDIEQTPPGIICQGSEITLTADPVNPGSAPQYFWEINGVPAGTNDPVLTASNLSNGDVVTVMMVSNATCLLNDTAYSPPFVVVINSQPAPLVNITSNPPAVLCPQQICLFTSNVTNGGSTPSYQWHLNGFPVGTNNPLYTAATPGGVLVVYVTVTPSTGCPPVDSDEIIFNVVPTYTPEVIISASVNDSICPGQPVTFNAVASNTGLPPVYTWYLNGVQTGDTTDIFFLSSFNEGDEIYVTATSAYQCLSPDFAVSDELVYHIFPPVSIDITNGPITICKGEEVNLSMEVNGGKSSTYQFSWNTPGFSTPAISFYPELTGYYYGYVDEACYNSVSDSIFIDVLPIPVTKFSWEPLKPTVFTPHVNFTDESVDAISWNWTIAGLFESNERHPEYTFPGGGLFPVSLITQNQFGCADTLIKILEVEDFITAYFPNSFTPNGDGRNDAFGLYGASTGGYSMQIFNRWGQVIFNSENGYETWNGTDSKGNAAPEGIYVYNLVIANDKSKKPYTGTVTLIR